jgi:hypothetical protein
LWPLDHHVYFVSSIIGTVGLDVIGFVRLVPFCAVFGGGDTGRRVSVADAAAVQPDRYVYPEPNAAFLE